MNGTRSGRTRATAAASLRPPAELAPTPAAIPVTAPATETGPTTASAAGNTAALLQAEAPAPAAQAVPPATATITGPGAASQESAGPTTAPSEGAAAPADAGEQPAAPEATGGEGAAGAGAGGSEAVRILGRALPSIASQALAASQVSAEREVAANRIALESNPPSLQAPSGLMPGSGEAGPEGGESGRGPPAGATGVEDTTGEGGEPAPAETGHVVSEAPVPSGPSADTVVDRAPEDPVARAARYQSMIARMPVSDQSVNTDPGPAPTVELTGEADPGRIAAQATDNELTLGAEWQTARRGMIEDEGVDDIYPSLPEEQLVAPVSPGGQGIPPVAQPEYPTLRPGVRAGMDQGLGTRWAAEVTNAEAGQQQAMDERMREEAARRAETDREIAGLEADTANEQTGYRSQARADVADARAGWQAELDDARGTYDGERTRIDRNLDRDVDLRVAQADGDAQRHLDAGQRRADERRQSTETEAERRRTEAERRRDEADGFFDWIASRVKRFFRALQEGLKRLFDALRAAVRTIIEGAKRLAAAAIELGRRAVIGLIRTAGRALEVAADFFLAAFPAARDRAKALIRAGTERAEEAVNRAAEALRAGVFALLDALGDALVFILDVYEAFYSALFSALEFLVLGFIEVQRALFRLDLAARYAPGELEGQIYEEMIGADITQPLVFEATPREIADWEVGLGSGVTAEGGGAAAPGAAVPAMPTAVEAEPVVDFAPEPELVNELDFSQGPIEFGDNNAPGNTLAEVHADAIAGEGEAEEGEVGSAPAEADDAQMTGDGGPGSAIPGETTDEKLDHYINQGAPQDCRTQTPTAPEGPPMPLSAKIGPLSRTQRARYMLNQAWTGIQHWVRCNWPTILAAILVAIIAIAAIVAIVVLSGGTVGVALTGILTAFTGAMIIYAIARAAGFLGDYLQKSLDGDIIGGARGLARALAVAAVEIIFAILTYVTAGAFRVIAAGIKGAGRLASAGARGAGRLAAGAARQSARGARAVGRGAMRAGRSVASATGRAGRAAGRVGSALVRRGRLVIRNVRSGFERGARSLRDLGRRLGQRLRFRRFKLERRGGWFRLYGLLNPWVLLANGRIERHDNLGNAEVGDLVSIPGRRQPGIVVGIKTRTGGPRGSPTAVDFDSRAVAALRAQSGRARTRFHRTHRTSQPNEIRAALDVGSETSRNSRILAQNMRNTPRSGRPVPNPGDHAHHLVPSTDPRGAIARRILIRCGVDINDASNGLFMSAGKHARMHTNAGYQRITNMLSGATTRSEALQILDDIAGLIAKNKFP